MTSNVKMRLTVCILVLLVAGSLESQDEQEEKKLSREKRFLFGQYESLNLAMCIVEPIELLRGGTQSYHRVSLNTGFNVGYGLPYKVSQFTAPIFWSARSLIDSAIKDSILVEDEKSVKNVTKTKEKRSLDSLVADEREERKKDLSAGEFYAGMKQYFSLMGYEEECVLKSICELAKIPFHEEEEDNLLHEVLHFVLTPSLHQAFDDESEGEEKRIHEEAERIGKTTGLCDEAYPQCNETPLHKRSEYFDFNDLRK